MQIDKRQLQALCELNDREFGELIYKAIISSGSDPYRARSMMAAAPIIKNKLKNMNDREFSYLINLIGRENTAKILNEFKSKREGN